MRSAAAQAIIAPLSVQSASGGARKRAPASAPTASSPARIVRLAATPPATARTAPRRWRSAKARRARRVFSARVSATAAWKPAQRSARSPRVSPPFAATRLSRARRTAVLRPEKERSHPVAVEERAGEGEAAGVAGRRLGLDGGAAGLAEAEELRHLVEGLARGVVDGAAEAGEGSGPSTARNWQWPPETSRSR